MSKNVAILGATGAVGQELLSLLAERNFPLKSLKLLASKRSAGKTIEFRGEKITVEELTHDSFKGVDLVYLQPVVQFLKNSFQALLKQEPLSLTTPVISVWTQMFLWLFLK